MHFLPNSEFFWNIQLQATCAFPLRDSQPCKQLPFRSCIIIISLSTMSIVAIVAPTVQAACCHCPSWTQRVGRNIRGNGAEPAEQDGRPRHGARCLRRRAGDGDGRGRRDRHADHAARARSAVRTVETNITWPVERKQLKVSVALNATRYRFANDTIDEYF